MILEAPPPQSLNICLLQGQAVASSMVPGAATYWVPGGPSPISPGKQPITSSEEDPDERSTAGGHGGLVLCLTHVLYI